MSEEQKEFYEIRKSSVKQFLIIVCGSFIGCLLALILMGQILKPKFQPCPYGRMMPPPQPMAQQFHRGSHGCPFKQHIREHKPAPHNMIKNQDKKFHPVERTQLPARDTERK